jgi:hypothetical protein
MDFFKGLFGMNSTAPTSSQTTAQGPAKASTTKVGPQVHPKHPSLVFSCMLVPNPANPALPAFWFCIWEQGIASYYRYNAKKKEDKTAQILYNSLSNPGAWAPAESTTTHVVAIEANITAETNANSPTKPAASKRAELKLKQLEASESGSIAFPPDWPFQKDMTTAYLDRLNKLLLFVDKKLKSNSEYSGPIHTSLYVCLLESTRLAHVIYHDSTLDSTQKVVRLKMLNEWITRVLLTLDNIIVPLIKDASVPSADSSDPEAEEWIPDPEIRAKRKSLVNLALGIGSDLSSIIADIDPNKAASSSQAATKLPPSMKNLWELDEASSEVYQLLKLANPHHSPQS